jgi:hypothetical protein
MLGMKGRSARSPASPTSPTAAAAGATAAVLLAPPLPLLLRLRLLLLLLLLLLRLPVPSLLWSTAAEEAIGCVGAVAAALPLPMPLPLLGCGGCRGCALAPPLSVSVLLPWSCATRRRCKARRACVVGYVPRTFEVCWGLRVPAAPAMRCRLRCMLQQ